ncbi:MAG: hypothetical protein ACJ75B_07385 [Flavisolibacter sp.]
MKKILAAICCVLCMHSFSQPPMEVSSSHHKFTGEKVLLKAIAVIVNPEANKKIPIRKVNICPLEPPFSAQSPFIDQTKVKFNYIF